MTKPGDPTKPTGDERDRALARLEKALGEALAASEASEAIVEDQRQRLKLLGTGREETMRALAEARAELTRVSRERDELRKQLTRIDSVQTATIALPENDSAALREQPTYRRSKTSWPRSATSRSRAGTAGHLHQHVQATRDTDDSEEMIAPRLVFPEQFAETAKPGEGAAAAASRVLVLLDPERPIKYPLYKETMTIGRADIADIQIDNGFLSRLHARVISTPEGVTIEDFESKNGIRVNAKVTPRQMLRHGDVVDLGRLRFRFIDTASDDAD